MLSSTAMNFFANLAKPSYIVILSKRLLPWGFWLTAGCFLIGIIWGLVFTPADYQQGYLVKIMFVHVPASWWALGVYTLMALSAATGLITRIPLYFYLTKALAPIGACFCLISLITGMIWGKPTWGTWWVWDARLTSMLILFFLYLGYLNLVHKIDQPKLLSMASILVVLGLINVPIIKWSVDWWYTLHQPASLLRFARPAVHGQFLVPLLIMVVAFGLYTFTVGLWHLKLILKQCYSVKRERS